MSGLPHVYSPTLSMTVPQYRARIVSVEPVKREWPRWMRRFLSDCRDLWSLIRKGQPVDDPVLPWRLLAETAKLAQPKVEDLDAWEADMFAKSGAWWFDPARYDGTPFAWPARPKPRSFPVLEVRDGARDPQQQTSAADQMAALQGLANSGIHGALANQMMMNNLVAQQHRYMQSMSTWNTGVFVSVDPPNPKWDFLRESIAQQAKTR